MIVVELVIVVLVVVAVMVATRNLGWKRKPEKPCFSNISAKAHTPAQLAKLAPRLSRNPSHAPDQVATQIDRFAHSPARPRNPAAPPSSPHRLLACFAVRALAWLATQARPIGSQPCLAASRARPPAYVATRSPAKPDTQPVRSLPDHPPVHARNLPEISCSSPCSAAVPIYLVAMGYHRR